MILAGLAAVLAGAHFLGGRVVRMPFDKQGAVPGLAAGQVGYVQVAVADVRAAPDPAAELFTQALLGDPVRVTRVQGGWAEGRVPDGYTGWLKGQALAAIAPPAASAKAAVIVPRARLHAAPDTAAASSGEALLGTDLPLMAQRPGWRQVWHPAQGSAWLREQDSELWPKGAPPGAKSGSQVVATARLLAGTPYLWGGVSAYGVDCSGLSYISYFLNGVQLLRDADQQFTQGRWVEKTDLAAGDLVFFNTGCSDSIPTHVGIYIREGQFINSRSSQGVVVSRLEEPIFASSYLGARRYLP